MKRSGKPNRQSANSGGISPQNSQNFDLVLPIEFHMLDLCSYSPITSETSIFRDFVEYPAMPRQHEESWYPRSISHRFSCEIMRIWCVLALVSVFRCVNSFVLPSTARTAHSLHRWQVEPARWRSARKMMPSSTATLSDHWETQKNHLREVFGRNSMVRLSYFPSRSHL